MDKMRILGIPFTHCRQFPSIVYDDEAKAEMVEAMKRYAAQGGPVLKHGKPVGHVSFVGYDESGKPVMNIHVNEFADELRQ